VTDVRTLSLTGSSRIRLYPLAARADGELWVVGRLETGVFIAVPEVGRRAVALLSDGHTLDQIHSTLQSETGSDIDVAGFVHQLVELGFVTEVDGRALHQAAVPPPTLPWLRQQHVRWLLSPVTGLAAGLTVLAAVAVVAAGLAPLPNFRHLIWSDSGGAVLLGNTALAWTIIALHELAHLTTARAAGIPGRMSLGTRLQFLVAQTDVSGVWALPRRTRLVVYLAGISTNLVTSALCVLIPAAVELPAPMARLTAAAGLLSLLFIPAELLVFMRTDIYYVLQDLTHSTNLYANGAAYARFQAARLWHRVGPAGPAPADPSRHLPATERRAVRGYTVLLVTGTAACLATALTVTLPATATLVDRAVTALASDPSPAGLFDAVTVLAITGAAIGLWSRAWWRRHGDRVRRWTGRLTNSRERR
jgi:hypothetical protein